MTAQEYKEDCRQFRFDRPCQPHKQSGKVCASCDEYDPLETRVLLIKLAALGDVLRTTALLPAMRAAFPSCRITWLTQACARGLFMGNALVDEVLDIGSASTVARLGAEEFDVVLCPDADADSVALAAAARAREHRGFTLGRSGRVVALGPDAEHWLRMGQSDPLKKANTETYQTLIARVLGLDPARVGEPILEPTAADRDAASALHAGLGFAGPLVGLNTGAGARWEYKSWTEAHQQTLLSRVAGVGGGVLLLGGPEQRGRHERLLAAGKGLPVFDAGTQHGFGRFAAILELCRVVVTGDTFALHVATARGVPVVALFGPTSAAEIELYGRGKKILPEGMDCLGCYLPVCDVVPHCQARILPDRVVAALAGYL